MNKMEIAWLAGILEGEGTFDVMEGKYIRITCGMTDKDIIERVQKIVNAGSVKTYTKSLPRKPLHVWTLCSQREVLDVLCAITPLMGERRRAKILEQANVAINTNRETKKRILAKVERVHCFNGHVFEDVGFFMRGNSKVCRQCKRDSITKWRTNKAIDFLNEVGG